MKSWTKFLTVALLALTLVCTLHAQNMRDPSAFAHVKQFKYGGTYVTAAAPISCTTGQTKYTDAMDVSGANRLQISAYLGAGDTNVHSVTLQTSADGVYWATPVSLTSARTGGTTTQAVCKYIEFTASAVGRRAEMIGVMPAKYIRLACLAGTTATAATFGPLYATWTSDGSPSIPGGERDTVVTQAKQSGVYIDATNSLAVAGGATGYTDAIKLPNDATTVAFHVNMLTSTSGATNHALYVQTSPDGTTWFDQCAAPAAATGRPLQNDFYNTVGSWGATANTCKAFTIGGMLPTKYVRLKWVSEAAKNVTLGPIYMVSY